MTEFVVHRSEVSTFKGDYCVNGRKFNIVLRVSGVILFYIVLSVGGVILFYIALMVVGVILFYIALRVVGVILFFRMCPSKM